MRKSFTWFLSLMVLLTAFATSGYAQEEQETVELFAGKTSACYMQGNDYTVDVAVRDFIKLTKFELGLSFNDLIYTFVGVSDVNSSLSALTTSVTPVALGPDVLNLNWSGTAATIGDDVKTNVIKLHFELKGFPANTAVSFPTDLIWTKKNFWYTTSGSIYDAVNTVTATNGELKVNVSLTDIQTELTTETCAGEDVLVKVTAPAASMYLFNEDPIVANWVWTSSNTFLAKAGESVTIRVKSADGCISLMDEIMLPETLDSVKFTATTQNPLCYSEKGYVVINATGGTAPYTYWISTNADGSGAEKKVNFQFSQGPGTYYVSVTDANGCTVVDPWKMVTITDTNTPIVITETVTNVLCYGNSTGSIAVNVSGGATMVSLDGNTWKNLVGGAYTFTGLPAGTYTVWAKNANECTVSKKNIVITQPAGAIAFKITIDDTSCGGDNDGVITVSNVTGGTAPYEYSIDGLTWQTSNVFAGLEPTYYSLWVRDANLCVVAYDNPNGTKNTIAVQSPKDIQYKVTVTNPPCNNDDAVITISNVTGGTGSYTYSFDGGSTWGSVKTMDWAMPYAPVTVWVANADSACPVQYVVETEDVTNPDAINVAVLDQLAPTCIDGNDGNITLHITGGVKPYYYSINGSAWRMTEKAFTNVKVNVGTHNIIVKDKNGCEWGTEIEEVITLEESIIEATSDTHIDCFGTKTGSISVDFTSWAEGLNGNVPFRNVTYWVQNQAGNVSSFTPSNQGGTATLFNAGIYVVWAVDQYTCESNRDTAWVTQNDELLIADVTSNGASCFETFEGNITIYATGGNTSDLEYAIVNNEGALGNITDDKWLPFDTYNPLVKPALSTVSFQVDGGTYWLAVRDDGCDELTYGPVVVEGYTELLVDEDEIVITDPLCYRSGDGTITVPMAAVTGGAGSYKFTLWMSDGEGGWHEMIGRIDQATGMFAGLSEGVYKVLVEDAEDCPSYTTDEIVLEDPEMLTFDTEIYHFSCEGSNDGIITIDIDGGTPDYWYAVNNPNAWVAIGKDLTTKTYIATEPGMFILWVKDANGCITEPDTVYILEPTVLSANITVNNNVSCNGGSDGRITVVGTGGWAGMTQYAFKVNSGSWTSSTVLSGLPAGTHTLHIRDVNSYSQPYQSLDCEYSVNFTITQPGKITYDVIVENVKCKDGSDGTLTVNIQSGGTPWDLIGTSNDGYDVKITGDFYDSGWVRTGADFSHTFAGLAHSHYTVYIQDSRGCVLFPTVGNSTSPYTTIESWEVNEPDTYLTLDAKWLKDATCYGSKDGEIKFIANGGTPPYKYYAGLSIEPDGHVLTPAPPAANSALWSSKDTLKVGAGTWVVWVLDANGCMVGGEYENNVPVNKWRVKVEQPDQIVWDFHKTGNPLMVHYVMPKCNGDWNGEIHLVNISGGSGKYNATVKGKSAAGEDVNLSYSDIAKYLSGGLYRLPGVPASSKDSLSVTVTDMNGCTSVVRKIMVKQPDVLAVTLEESPDNYTCFGTVEGWIEATAMGGTAPYQYQLLKNGVVHTPWQSIASAFLVQVGNTFTVEVKDKNGCLTSAELVMPTPMKVEFTSIDLSCNDDVKASAKITATGTPGRMFNVWYKEIGDLIPTNKPFIKYNGTFAESIVINDVFLYDNENYVDRHYAVYVEDDHGCQSLVDTLTFDQVQTAVSLNVTTVETTECTQVVKITTNGGVGAYVVMVNDEVITDMTVALARGTNVIKVMDSHMCSAEQTVEVTGVYVTRDTTISTYIGETTSFVDAEAGVDTMLAVGNHTWVYTLECERTLNVEVIEVPRPYTIAEVQGEGDVSPIEGKIAKITGTVTAIAPGEGFFVQDANAANSGIWVEHSGVNDLGIAVGGGVSVVGEVAEIASVTSIVATEVMDVEGTIEIMAMEMTPSATEAEMYESVLVTVPGARATAADEGTGEWTIYLEDADNVIVNDWLYKSTPVEMHFYNVTGIVNGRLDAFKLEPRMESDVVDITATPVENELENTFKVYPNPFNAQITIDNNEKLTRVVISNIAGQRVIDIEYPTREIRTANLVSGIYVVSLYTESGIVKTERMIKR